MQQFKKAFREYDIKSNQELNKTGIFYAFSEDQFNKNKIPKHATTDFINIGGGGYIHKSNKSKLDNYFNNILPRLKQELTTKINITDLIEYELINYECYYIGDYTEIINVIKSFYKDISDSDLNKKIQDVYYRHQKREDNKNE